MPFQNTNLTTLIALERNRLSALSSVFWTTQEIIDALNEGLRFYNLCTGRFKGRLIITTIPSRCIYDLTDVSIYNPRAAAPPVVAPLRVNFNRGAPLGWSSVSDMDIIYPGWQLQTTSSGGGVPTTPQMAGPLGLNMLFLWPADNVGGNSLALDAVVPAPILVNGTDFVNLDNAEITALLDFAEWRLMLKKGGIYVAQAQPLLRQFLRMAAGRNSYLRTLSLYKSAIGDDRARRTNPRRIEEREGVPFGIGQRA